MFILPNCWTAGSKVRLNIRRVNLFSYLASHDSSLFPEISKQSWLRHKRCANRQVCNFKWFSILRSHEAFFSFLVRHPTNWRNGELQADFHWWLSHVWQTVIWAKSWGHCLEEAQCLLLGRLWYKVGHTPFCTFVQRIYCFRTPSIIFFPNSRRSIKSLISYSTINFRLILRAKIRLWNNEFCQYKTRPTLFMESNKETS